MPDTLKKLREPAALAAVVFAGLVLLSAVINLLVPPSVNGISEPFANRALGEVTQFLDVTVAAAAAYAVYLANHVSPALAKARLITLAALIELGVALLFGVVTALALWGADGEPGESKFLSFLVAIGSAAVVAVAGLFVWLTWQALAPAAPRPAQAGGQYGGGWQGGGGPGTGGQQYGQPSPPPGGFGWNPQQPQAPAQPGYGQQPGQSGPTAFGQQQGGQPGFGGGQPGAANPQQPFGADRTQLLPPVPPTPPSQPGHAGQQGPAGYGQQSGAPGAGQSASGTQQGQPPAPPTMQNYAAQSSPWSPGGPAGGQPPQPPQPPQHGQPPVPPTRAEDEQRPDSPFPIGEWRSE